MKKLEEIIGYTFHNKRMLQCAMTHSSFANESRDKSVTSNERLEFLGDSVLGFVTADYIFSLYKHIPEGELTRLRASVVCEQSLFEVAKKLELSKFIKLGRGESMNKGNERPSILSDAVEAIIGAVYIDGGIEPARKFVLSFIKPAVETAVKGRAFRDYKTILQEIVQKNKEEVLTYKLIGEKGPDHDRHFLVEVLINSNPVGTGEGRSKKEAEQLAAKCALELMGEEV